MNKLTPSLIIGALLVTVVYALVGSLSSFPDGTTEKSLIFTSEQALNQSITLLRYANFTNVTLRVGLFDFSFFDPLDEYYNFTGITGSSSIVSEWFEQGNASLRTESEPLQSTELLNGKFREITFWVNSTGGDPVTNIARWFGGGDVSNDLFCSMGYRVNSFILVGSDAPTHVTLFPLEAEKKWQGRIVNNGTDCLYFARNYSSQEWINIYNETPIDAPYFELVKYTNEGPPSATEIIYFDAINATQPTVNLNISLSNLSRQYNSSISGLPVNITLALNTTSLHMLLDDLCNCEGCTSDATSCYPPLKFESTKGVNILLSNPIINYSYGIAECPATAPNPYQLFNLTYFDEISLSPITLSNLYTLNVYDPFEQTIGGTFPTANTSAFCTNVNITKRGLNYLAYGTFSLSRSGYTSRIYTNTQANPYTLHTNPFYSLPLYLLSTGNTSTVTFTIKDLTDSNALPGVNGKMFLYSNGSYIKVEEKVSDIIGNIVYSYTAGSQYLFNFTLSGYQPYSFQLNPITSSSYDVFMTRLIEINETQDYARVSIDYAPKIYYENQGYVFNWSIYSPYEELINYGYVLSYPGGFVIENGTTPGGSTLSDSFTIGDTTPGDRVRLQYYYTLSGLGTRKFNYYFEIIQSTSNNTLIASKDNHYGMGILERVIVAVFVVILLVGISAIVGQTIPGVFLGLGVYGYFVYIGFIPVWLIIIPIMAFLIIASSRSE